MIWVTVSSQPCFCWLYKASPSLAAKNIINLILVLMIYWCPCVESSIVLLKEGICYEPWREGNLAAGKIAVASMRGQTVAKRVWSQDWIEGLKGSQFHLVGISAMRGKLSVFTAEGQASCPSTFGSSVEIHTGDQWISQNPNCQEVCRPEAFQVYQVEVQWCRMALSLQTSGWMFTYRLLCSKALSRLMSLWDLLEASEWAAWSQHT